MNQYVQIFLCAVALAFIAKAIFDEFRIRGLQGRLAECEQKDADAEISKRVHALSDAELNDELNADDGGRNKPSA